MCIEKFKDRKLKQWTTKLKGENDDTQEVEQDDRQQIAYDIWTSEQYSVVKIDKSKKTTVGP